MAIRRDVVQAGVGEQIEWKHLPGSRGFDAIAPRLQCNYHQLIIG